MPPRPLSALEQSARFLRRAHVAPPSGPIRNAAAWRAEDLGPESRWLVRLTPGQVADLERAIAKARASGKEEEALEREDFALGELAPEIECWRAELMAGRGFVLRRGLPVARWSAVEARLALRAIALQLGRPGAQNARGDIIGEVRNTGAASSDPFIRNYATDREFRFHCDAADLLGLLCIRPAARGGHSRLASSVAVFNEIQRLRPDLARRLFEPLPLDLRNEQGPGASPVAPLAPCAHANGELSTLYVSDYFRSAARHPGVSLSASERELLDVYDTIASSPDFAVGFHLEPGDLQLVNNHVLLHARTAFEDEPGLERLLLRVLISLGA